LNPDHLRPRYRVLLVEDHPELAEVTAEFMQSMALDVRIASTGREALEMAAAFQPKIVLCDARLPDMSGLHVVRQLRAMPGNERVVMAIHSAMAEQDLRAMARDAGVDLALSKPLTAEGVAALISALEAKDAPDADERQ
jgi:two-component system alkaline phosphatase synthesis response regulator PhoP